MQARSKLLRSMDSFLRSCSAALKRSEEEGSAVHVVLGNEACDLDSMISAITFAYFLAKTSAKTPKTLIPVLNIPRSELPLRTEGTYFLRENGIAEESLVLRDEVDLHALHRAGQLLLTLVDHNVLPGADSVLEGAVVEVVDHRPLERAPSAGCAVTSEPVGSCATLIAERIARSAPHVLDKQVAALLYGTIVLDCVNMAPEAGKVTPKDRELVALLESKFTNLPQRATLFESLQRAKFNVAGLSTEQMLQKDMKAVGGDDVTVAISGVYMRLEAFLQRSGLQQELCEFCHKHRHAALVAMTISFSDGNQPYRQIAVYSYSTRLREQLCQALENSQNPHLNLSPIASPYPHIKAYHQGNTLASRKKVLPIIKEFLRERERAVHAGTGGEELEDQFDSSCRTPPLEEEARHHRYSASRRRRQAAEDSGTEEDSQLPPTPMNSLVEGCPLDNGLPRLTADTILEKFSRMAKEEENWGERDLPSGQ